MPLTTRKYAVVASTFGSDAREIPTRARQAGFQGLLFDAFSDALDVTDLSGTGRREFRHVLAGQDRQLAGLRVDLGAKGFGPGADVDRLLHRLDKVLAAAAELVAPLVCVDLGLLPEPPRESKPKPAISPDEAGFIFIPSSAAAPAPAPIFEEATEIDPAFCSQVNGAMLELGSLADRYNVTVAFRTDLSSFAAIHQALNAARCPWFGVDLDPVSMLRDAWTEREIFSSLGSIIHHVRGRDAIKGSEHRTKPAPIGRGDTKWDELLSNLDGAGYHGWITLDPIDLQDRAGGAISGLKYLKLHE